MRQTCNERPLYKNIYFACLFLLSYEYHNDTRNAVHFNDYKQEQKQQNILLKILRQVTVGDLVTIQNCFQYCAFVLRLLQVQAASNTTNTLYYNYGTWAFLPSTSRVPQVIKLLYIRLKGRLT